MLIPLSLKDAAVTATILVPILTIAANFLDSLLYIEVSLDREHDAETMGTQQPGDVFDYIIVGGGSAGCVLANRLSENPRVKILLLDAGGIPTQLQSIPTLSYALNNQQSVDWAHRTVPQSHAGYGLNYNVSFWPAGKTLGGSSAIHGMINIRGNVQGFDIIAARTRNPMWRMNNVLKYYQKVENYRGVFSSREHGIRGQMGVEGQTMTRFTDNVLRAARELGYKVRDPNANSPNVEGFAPIEFYLDSGRRADAYHSSLKYILPLRPNLVLRKFSFVTKIHFRNGNQAYGVSYERHGLKFFARATKEVILSAGALSTPKILMLSGIGPRTHLAQHKIPVIVDLPVGLNLQDKYGAAVGPFMVPPGYGFDTNRDVNVSSITQWVTTGKGLVGSGGTEATWVINSEYSKALDNGLYPDIHSYVLGISPTSNGLSVFAHCFNFNEASVKYLGKSVGHGDGFFQLVTINRAYGVGYVRLRDVNPHSPLIIDPKYLQHPRDVKTLVEGIKFSVKLVEATNAFREIGAKLFPVPYPGCEGFPFKSDLYYECLARHATVTAYKYCGTAPMGKDTSDGNAVVDSYFRVMGVDRLRVIDGSLFKIQDLNTNDVTVRMLGEMGSEVIKKYWTS